MTLDEDMAPTVAAREVGLFFGKEPGKEEEKEAPADPWLANGPPPKWQKQDSQRGKGHQQQWWNPTSAKRGWESAQTYSSDIQPMDSQTVEFLKALTKLSLKHEDELRRQRPDQDFMAFFDVGPHGFLETMKAAAEEWATQYDQGKVKSALRHIMFLGVIRELKLRLHAAISDEVKSARYRTMHWTVEGPTPQNPAWNYFRWNPSRFVGGAGPAIPPGRHGTAGAAGEALHGGQQPDQVRFHQEHGGAVYESDVLPFQISIGMRSASSDLCHSALMRLTGSEALKVMGLRVRPGRAARQPCAKALEQAYLSTPFCDWQQRRPARAQGARSRGGVDAAYRVSPSWAAFLGQRPTTAHAADSSRK